MPTMTDPIKPPMKLNLLQRLGGWCDHGVGLLGKILRELAKGFWTLLGSDQLRNLILMVALILLAFMASRVLYVEQHLKAVAESSQGVADAQRIQGFAIMHQLKAMGIVPNDTVPAPAASSAPAHAHQDPQAINPDALQHSSPATPVAEPGAQVPR